MKHLTSAWVLIKRMTQLSVLNYPLLLDDFYSVKLNTPKFVCFI